LVEGSEANLKVTTGPDLALARFWIECENDVLFSPG
jgi:2-C-methyl-D-erythritol 4-phosphate cytidylyltransferase